MKHQVNASCDQMAAETSKKSFPRADGARSPYRTPVLIQYGDIRDITLGSTSGIVDSDLAGGPLQN